jgi:hypothetical protein
MKAVVMTGANKPWEVQEVPTPTAEPGQVLVKVHASGMCYTDVWATTGYGGDIYPQTRATRSSERSSRSARACTPVRSGTGSVRPGYRRRAGGATTAVRTGR